MKYHVTMTWAAHAPGGARTERVGHGSTREEAKEIAREYRASRGWAWAGDSMKVERCSCAFFASPYFSAVEEPRSEPARLAFVGEAPNAAGGNYGIHHVFFYRAKMKRAARKAIHLRNVFDSYPGREGRGSAFPIGPAKKRARAILCDFAKSGGDAALVIVGKRAARAFGIASPEYFAEERLAVRSAKKTVRAFVVPHPSGVNRWWNEPANVAAARAWIESQLN